MAGGGADLQPGPGRARLQVAGGGGTQGEARHQDGAGDRAGAHGLTTTLAQTNISLHLQSSEYILLALLLINCICLRKSVTLISLSLEMLRWGREVTV